MSAASASPKAPTVGGYDLHSVESSAFNPFGTPSAQQAHKGLVTWQLFEPLNGTGDNHNPNKKPQQEILLGLFI